MRKSQKQKRQQKQKEAPIIYHSSERLKTVSFDPCKNNTRIFHKQDTPISIRRIFKKPNEEQENFVLKPILRCSSSHDDLDYCNISL
jgi:hypothetical protein